MSSTAFDDRGLHAAEVAPQPLEALVAQDNSNIETATASVRKDTAAVETARQIVITDETYEEAERQIVQWKLAVKEAHLVFDPVCASAFEIHKKATGARSSVIDPLEQACRILSGKLADHLAARQRAEQETQRFQLEVAKAAAELQRESEIEQAEAAGASVPEVQAIIEMPLPPESLTHFAPTRRATQSSPFGLDTTYKAKVTNHLELVRYVAAHPQFVNLIPVDQAAPNRLAATLKTTLMLPGVEVYTENSTAVRRG